MVQAKADEFFARAIAAANAGDVATMEAEFRACLTHNPNHPLALLNLGAMLMKRGDHAHAEPLLRQAVAAQASVDSVSMLASLLEVTGRLDKAEACYQDILKAMPTHAPTLKAMGGLCERASKAFEAGSYYQRAWQADPSDVDAAIRYAITNFDYNPAIAAEVMDRLLADHASNDGLRAAVMRKLLIYKEFHARMQRGLMPYHATSLDELFFTYCASDFELYRKLCLQAAEKAPHDPGALLGKFTALFCSRDRRGAQECLQGFASRMNGTPFEAMTFDPAFYHEMEKTDDTSLFQGLPPISTVTAANFKDEHITYLSCNISYFIKFAIPLIRSFAHTTPGGQLHVHVMDATDDQLKAIAAFCRGLANITTAISAERPGVDAQGAMAARSYYHAIRFVRFYQHVEHYGRTLWMMDVDALFNRDAREMYSALGDEDAAFRIRAGRFEPWSQFSAAVIGATGHPTSLAYFRLIAGYIAHFHRLGKITGD